MMFLNRVGLVGTFRPELPVDAIQRTGEVLVGPGCLDDLASQGLQRDLRCFT